jgi:hypothetical protein
MRKIKKIRVRFFKISGPGSGFFQKKLSGHSKKKITTKITGPASGHTSVLKCAGFWAYKKRPKNAGFFGPGPAPVL